MRRLIRWGILLAVLWCAWWALASYGAHLGSQRLFAERAEDGWRAELGQSGFPFRIQTQAEDLRLTNPVAGTAVQMDRARLSAPTYWPGFLRIDLPETPIIIETGTGPVELTAADAAARLNLTPGTALTLRDLSLQSTAWQLRAADSDMLAASGLTLTATQDTEDPLRYNVAFDVQDLQPGPLIRTLIALPSEWPKPFEVFTGQAALTFDKPLDRFAGEAPQARARRIDLQDVVISWGPLTLNAQGQLTLDDTGQPDGVVEAQLTQWPQLLDIASNAGALPPSARLQAELMLRAAGNLAGDPDDLDLTLSFARGRMALGPIDLGPAPRFYRQKLPDR